MPVNRRARARATNRARAASAIRGSKSFRRLLKGMPDAVRAEMADVLTKTGPQAAAIVEQRIAGTTKRRTGRLLAGVKWKVYPRTLRMQTGFLATKAGRAKLFYARILDLGRKRQTVTIRRGPRAGKSMTVSAIRAKRFVTGGIGDLRRIVNTRLNGIWDRALRRVATGDE